MTLRQRWKQTSLPNKLLVVTGAFVAFGTLFYAGAAAFQVYIMKVASDQSSEQIERLVGKIDESISKATQSSGDSVKDALRQNQSSIDASLKQSKAALSASIEEGRLDQRAWIGLDVAKTDPETLEVDKRGKVVLSFKNTGKTPARNVRAMTIIDPVSPGVRPNFSYAHEKVARFGTLPPNANDFVSLEIATSRSTGEPRPIIKPLLDSLKSAQVIIYVHGQTTYQDIFGRSHWLTICLFLHNISPGPSSFAACGEHNDTGDGDNPQYEPDPTMKWPPPQ